MFRYVKLTMSHNPNALFKKGTLVAVQDIHRGERIRIPYHKLGVRKIEEREELKRLSEVSKQHARRN